MALAVILLVPAPAMLGTAWGKVSVPVPPEPVALTLTGPDALGVNPACAAMLEPFPLAWSRPQAFKAFWFALPNGEPVPTSPGSALARHRGRAGSLTRVAFLPAHDDVFAQVATVAAGLVIAYPWCPAWPDLIVSLSIAAMNADAVRRNLVQAGATIRTGGVQ